MSIIGRAVGVGLAGLVSLILMWFIGVVWHPPLFEATLTFINTPYTAYALMALSFIVFFYLGNGVRHVLWDFGIGVTPKAGRLSGNIVLVLSAFLTLFLWLTLCGCFSGETAFDVSEHLAMFKGDE